LLEALNFEGFVDCKLLIQEYVEHSEQVYKLYAIGPNYFGIEIRESIPHDRIINSEKGFAFDSQGKFLKTDYTYFTTESRLDVAKTAEFIALFTDKFKMLLFGIDVIITKEGRHLVIDCNYFSSYTGIPLDELASKFDSLYEEIKPRVVAK
jgi:hypothetical protein